MVVAVVVSAVAEAVIAAVAVSEAVVVLSEAVLPSSSVVVTPLSSSEEAARTPLPSTPRTSPLSPALAANKLALALSRLQTH